MLDFFVRLCGLFIAYVSWISLNHFLKKVPGTYRGILAAALVPIVLGLTLGYILLLSPNLSTGAIRTIYLIAATAIFAWVIHRDSANLLPGLRWTLILPLLISIPVFLIVRPEFSSFDPANYALIGKTFILDRAIRDFPFVLPGRGTHIFSWFSHPPLLSLIYAWLSLFRLDMLTPYVGAIFFMLLLCLVFTVVRQRSKLVNAATVSLFLGISPIAVTTAALGFTAPLRMFFFTATGVLLADSTDDFSPVTIGIFAGAAMAIHTIGLLTLPAVVGYLLFRHKKQGIKPAFHFLLAACAVGGFWYGWNLIRLGALDTTPIFKTAFPDLTRKAVAFQFTQRGMISAGDKLLKGILGPLTRISDYGITFLFGFLLLLSAIYRRSKRLLYLSPILITYLLFHLFPGHFRIAILSPRYPLTVLPLLLIAGADELRGKYRTATGMALVFIAGLLTTYFWNPYSPEPNYYGPMKKIIQAKIGTGDKVLAVHCPYFFLYNHKSGRDSMDPNLLALYRAPSVKRVLSLLKAHHFTHILMPWAPTPFESDSFIKRLFVTPGILVPYGHNSAFYLYKIDYPSRPLLPPATHSHPLLSDFHQLPLVQYTSTGMPDAIRFWDSGSSISVLSLTKKTLFAFAKHPLWVSGAGSLPTGNSRLISISFRLRRVEGNGVIHPIVAEYDVAGNRIRLSHPKPVPLLAGSHVFVWPTVYPGFDTARLQLDSKCQYLAIGFSFYRNRGGMSIERLHVIGFK